MAAMRTKQPFKHVPSPPLATLGETVDLLGVVVAKMSEKLDQHGETLTAVQKTALESRDAAQAAKAHTDPMRRAEDVAAPELDPWQQAATHLPDFLDFAFPPC